MLEPEFLATRDAILWNAQTAKYAEKPNEPNFAGTDTALRAVEGRMGQLGKLFTEMRKLRRKNRQHPQLKSFERDVLSTGSAPLMYDVAVKVRKARWLEAEKFIAMDAIHSACYASQVVRGRWEEGEAAISTDPYWSYIYASHVLEDRFPAGELTISQSPIASAFYAAKCLQGPWPEAERTILTCPLASFVYALGVLERRWHEAEPVIAQSKHFAEKYSVSFTDGPVAFPSPKPFTATEPPHIQAMLEAQSMWETSFAHSALMLVAGGWEDVSRAEAA